ncbi:MAG: cell surface protein, partial [Chthoniobacteraceae bacterium]
MHKAIRFLPLVFAFAGASLAANSFEVFPAEVNLKFLRDRQSLVCRFTEPNGVQRNVTAQSKMILSDPAKARVEAGTVYPVADGLTTLKVEYNGQSVNVPVKVEEAKVDQPISFRLDVMPIFMRNTCNSGGCHGSARGKDGFRLSLFGYDPAGDYFRLTREQVGRRINLTTP